MIVISYDIRDDKLRAKFAKTLIKRGAIRLQYSVYEINNTNRVINIVIDRINSFYASRFSGADSVMIFETDSKKVIKFGNAIHRDKDIVYL